ncbi:MAG: hypothetical protein F6K18_08335 [Okeania sp. SIO2C2]|uniref:hypothetical protein n=1 Tax=Okeania sp. SIO2C2 TaxID=2607787 RepID=UPI0013B86C86|nr:hypothetical protein [Okeania sp. SIO2C2]NEP86840.1 hypothetical protein [Okeania sp. SIO2C2]
MSNIITLDLANFLYYLVTISFLYLFSYGFNTHASQLRYLQVFWGSIKQRYFRPNLKQFAMYLFNGEMGRWGDREMGRW